MKPERVIARRYISASRLSLTAALLKWMSMIGVAVGVFSLVVVVAVMQGFENDFKQKIIGFGAPIEVKATEAATLVKDWDDLQKKYQNIAAIEERFSGELIIESTFGTSAGIHLRGTETPFEQIRGLGKLHFAKDPTAFQTDDDLPPIIIGSELAATLQVHPDFGDEVRLVFPFGDLSPTGEFVSRVRRFRVIGLFQTGFFEYDHKYAFVGQPLAERMFGDFGRRSWALFLENDHQTTALVKKLRQEESLSELTISSWAEQNRQLFEALKLERLGMTLLLAMIILIASFNIFALLSLVVLEKIGDLALLRSLGYHAKQIRRIVLWQAGHIGFWGSFFGLVTALIVVGWLLLFPVELPSSYYIEHLPVIFSPLSLVVALFIGIGMSWLAGLYPAYQAVRGTITEALRHD